MPRCRYGHKSGDKGNGLFTSPKAAAPLVLLLPLLFLLLLAAEGDGEMLVFGAGQGVWLLGAAEGKAEMCAAAYFRSVIIKTWMRAPDVGCRWLLAVWAGHDGTAKRPSAGSRAWIASR